MRALDPVRRRKGPRRIVECTCPRARHQHGTTVMYSKDGCRCDRCTDAKVAYDDRRRRKLAYGRWHDSYVDPGPARRHLLALRESGVGYRRVAELTGLCWATVQRLSADRSPRIREESAQAILAVPLGAHAHGATIDGTGTRRRVEALIAVGWTLNWIKARSGVNDQTLHDVLAGRLILEKTKERIRAAYEDMWDQAPPCPTANHRAHSEKARKRAAERGYVPPLAWDDETIDDPAAQPAEWKRHDTRIHAKGAVVEDMDWLRRNGVAPDEAARRMGMTPSGLEQAAVRADRPDLARWVRAEVKRKAA